MNPLEALLKAASKKPDGIIERAVPPKIDRVDIEVVEEKKHRTSMKRQEPKHAVEEKPAVQIDRTQSVHTRPRFCRRNKRCRVIADCQSCSMQEFTHRAACVRSNEIPEPIK